MFRGRVLAVTATVTAAVAIVVAAALVSTAAADRAAKAATSGSTTFSDPAGDANGAPDVTTVVIGDDPAGGLVEFALTANGMMAIDPASGPEVNVFIDTDRNPATGSPAGREFPGSPPGAEYRLSYERTSTDSAGGAEYWSGTSWLEAPYSSTMSVRDDTVTWQLGRGDLGTPSGFDFYVATEIFVNHQTVGLDRAPESGVWSYELQFSPATTTQAATTTESAVKPVIGSPTTTPRRPAAGKRLTIAFRVTRSDNGKPLANGRMSCEPSVQGKVIPHVESFKNGVARLALTIPTRARGKLLKVTLTIKLDRQSTTKVSAFRVG